MNNIQEVWKDINGYEGIYLISNLGRVKILPRIKINKGGCIISKEKFLKIWKSGDGYSGVALYSDKQKKYLLHRLLATAFILNPDNNPCINHINGIKNDNRLDNLEWCTVSENTQHSFDTGLQKPAIGETNAMSKLTEKQVLEIKQRLNSGESCNSISILYNISRMAVSHIKNNRRWKHLGYQE